MKKFLLVLCVLLFAGCGEKYLGEVGNIAKNIVHDDGDWMIWCGTDQWTGLGECRATKQLRVRLCIRYINYDGEKYGPYIWLWGHESKTQFPAFRFGRLVHPLSHDGKLLPVDSDEDLVDLMAAWEDTVHIRYVGDYEEVKQDQFNSRGMREALDLLDDFYHKIFVAE